MCSAGLTTKRLDQEQEGFMTSHWGYGNQHRAAMLAGIASVVLLSACTPPSFLITPVSGRRALVETELSRDSLFAFDKIAVIDVDGALTNATGSGLFSRSENPVSVLVEKLTKARRDPHVKAVLLRINSPGGTVVASELIHDEINQFKKTGKPIVAVIMDVGASGAYYIACSCDEIVAQPSSITGSIGVIMQMFDVSGTLHKLGASTDAITSGAFKDAGSPFREMRPEERAVFQSIVDDMYERFVAVVVSGRKNLDEAAVRKLADGRVYSASQALDAGLIDRIATLRESVELIKKRAGLGSVRIVAYDEPYGYRPNYYATPPRIPTGDVNLIRLDLGDLFDTMTPRFMYLWQPGL